LTEFLYVAFAVLNVLAGSGVTLYGEELSLVNRGGAAPGADVGGKLAP